MAKYTEIITVDQWKDVLEQSKEKAVIVFKHSTTCPISAYAYGEFTSFDSPVETYLVKVIEHRAVSNEIENDLGVRHESPQAFLIVDGRAVWNASHRKITNKELTKATGTL
ncbi:bacillithiol system redox-active protein YtxJ [Psychrobacillus sp. NEAU-3TGS]|uniref:bacillithiol system redox-active protein YtxJ n=1 Tax=Psychrobacillus sp. NEAU-3TGS TaxID=2995412 RepID=UPI0024960A6F|nr:bacillithiol system redox-active protein YtxJ [Psychrobacillus sp. NEAU-3TGS]MDI2587519.1 bacillithiol system redox-active protein YtxJ [Psychrobacillus sp. NEAU-3TGS]